MLAHPSWFTDSNVARFLEGTKETGGTKDDAVAYLLAEEGNLFEAIISYKGDRK